MIQRMKQRVMQKGEHDTGRRGVMQGGVEWYRNESMIQGVDAERRGVTQRGEHVTGRRR